ncbi:POLYNUCLEOTIDE ADENYLYLTRANSFERASE FAMILY PROTEIN [Salix purpurea]|uniref:POLYNUCLEOTIDE ADENYLYLTRANSFERASE FAMILY PROTEIN n=1 Tax=Salix purpurea TaxID=77065 RepID=A0A9Q0QEK6_SALPP|nr:POLYNUCLEOTIDE ADENYLYLTRANSFERASE FAMILY PROTEIN [Salix purpurea]
MHRVGIFAFHMVLVDQPQDPLVVAAFILVVHSGGSLLESVKIARRISQPYQSSFPELLEAQNPGSNNALMLKTINFVVLVRTALHNMTDGCYVSKAMAKYPKAPSSDLVRIYFYSSSLFCLITPALLLFSNINESVICAILM